MLSKVACAGRRVGHGLAGEAGGAPERLGVDGVDLHHRAHRHALGELVAQRGQLRAVVDARRPAAAARPRSARWAVDAVAVGDRPVTRAVLADDPAHRLAEDDAVAEALGELDRHELRAADEAALLRAAAGVDQPLDVARVGLVAGRGEVEEDEEQRDVARLAREDRGDGDVEQEAARGRRRTLASFHVSKVCESHSSARGAVHGASSGIVLAMSSSWRIAFSASTAPVGSGGTGPSGPDEL